MRVANMPIDSSNDHARSFGILSSYPPTPCGLATFSAALASGLSARNSEVNVVRVVDAGGEMAFKPISLSASWLTGHPALSTAARTL